MLIVSTCTYYIDVCSPVRNNIINAEDANFNAINCKFILDLNYNIPSEV